LASPLPDDDSDIVLLVSEAKHNTEKLRRMTSEVESMLDDLKRVQSEDLWKIGTGRPRTTLRIV
jgi:hypothetical protein